MKSDASKFNHGQYETGRFNLFLCSGGFVMSSYFLLQKRRHRLRTRFSREKMVRDASD
jgi:hypothetical protein